MNAQNNSLSAMALITAIVNSNREVWAGIWYFFVPFREQ
jgi:hypothetical protein